MNFCLKSKKTDKDTFIKIQSGFGGCNGALVYSKSLSPKTISIPTHYEVLRTVEVSPEGLTIDNQAVSVENTGTELVSEIYRKYLSANSRFYKMDMYSRLAYVATGLVSKDSLDGCEAEDIAIYLFTLNGSVLADRKHLSTFVKSEEYYPSPVLFINTLPNIVLGEIAAKNGIKGESSLIMLPEYNKEIIENILSATLSTTNPAIMICGWVDCDTENSFSAKLKLLKIK